MPFSNLHSQFYALTDLVSHDAFLEIEHVCLRNFPLHYCADATELLSTKWALYNAAMRQDTEFVELSTEVILGSMEDDGLYYFLNSSELLQRIFVEMSTSKLNLFNAFRNI